ncbi:MAG TPA: response regulator [Opitutaceae bacterium]|nr:response regulator [Opitutaceae bacterium]
MIRLVTLTATPLRRLVTAASSVRPGRVRARKRILIIDDNCFFTACLRELLNNEADLVVCATTQSSRGLSKRVAFYKPDLLVIDVMLGSESGFDLAQKLRTERIMTPILFVSTLDRPTRRQLGRIEKSAYAMKNKRPAQLLRALRGILRAHDTGSDADGQILELRVAGHPR